MNNTQEEYYNDDPIFPKELPKNFAETLFNLEMEVETSKSLNIKIITDFRS